MELRASYEKIQSMCERVRNACEAGVSVRAISSRSGISHWRMLSIRAGGAGAYRHTAALTDDECALINKALDEIKEII